MRLRNVEPGDVDLWRRLRCDPAMMAELGGAQDPAGIPDKVARDAAAAAADRDWILVVETDDERAAGTVALWTQSEHDTPYSEIGWMMLAEYQGQGLTKAAVREVLARASADGRWGDIHAYPSATNAASNALCRSTGFVQRPGMVEFPFNNTVLTCHHWVHEVARPTPRSEPGRDRALRRASGA